MNTEIIPSSVGICRFYNANKKNSAVLPWFVILFGGDRAECCDEVAVIKVDGDIVSLASIAPLGEDQSSGEPTIVGLYTLPSYRKQGLGKIVLSAAINRCIERGFEMIRIDAMSKGAIGTITSLPENLRSRLTVIDQSYISELMPE